MQLSDPLRQNIGLNCPRRAKSCGRTGSKRRNINGFGPPPRTRSPTKTSAFWCTTFTNARRGVEARTSEPSDKGAYMKKIIVLAIIAASVSLAQVPSSQAVALTSKDAPVAANAAANERQGPPKDQMSNEQAGVDIDRFIGNAVNTPVHLSHGTLLTHAILTGGNPYEGGAAGAVLEYRKLLSTATLLGMNRTPLSTLPDEYFFYVQSGEGRIDDGKQSWPLRPGIAVLAA